MPTAGRNNSSSPGIKGWPGVQSQSGGAILIGVKKREGTPSFVFLGDTRLEFFIHLRYYD